MTDRLLISSDFDATAKTTPSLSDEILIRDSEVAGEIKPVTIGSINEAGSQQQYFVSGTPVIFPPNGTVTTGGGFTSPSPFPKAYLAGAWVRLPAGAITSIGIPDGGSTGAAGLYWCVFSTTSVGQFKNNYVDPSAAEFIPRPPATVGTNATGSNAAFSNPVATDVLLANVTIPAGSMGLNGFVRGHSIFSHGPLGSNARKSVITFGAATVGLLSSTTKISAEHRTFIHNQGVTNKQFGWVSGSPITTDASALVYPEEDTTADVALKFYGNILTADKDITFVILNGFFFEIIENNE